MSILALQHAVAGAGAGPVPVDETGAFLSIGLGLFLVPLLSAVTLIFFGRKLPRGGDWIAQTAIVTCAVGALTMFWKVLVQHGTPGWSWSSAAVGQAWDWIALGGFHLSVGIYWDNLSVIMATMVTVVSSCIFFFSAGYMHGDRDYPRFFAYLSYFCFAMLGLVVVDNLLMLFVFWELVGVGSYLLIGFFYDQEDPPKASLKAFMVNRVGDVLFLLGIIICWRTFGTLRYSEIFATLSAGHFTELPVGHAFAGLSHHALLTLSGILIFCGAISKSAQVPLHTWLPDAMAGPTPVSALIHAATMVAAGVFMVGRMYPYFTPEALNFIAVVGAITALVGATMGLVMWDIKKVLAYSTMSQLGYMMLGLGVGGYVAGLFHLITHAFFKSCLFLGSGSVIHAVHSQDIRDMGGLKRKMPVTYWTFLIATLALAGVPCFAGYYSKDQIVATSLAWGMSHDAAHWMPFVFAAVGAFMTTFYMFRLVFLTFHGKPADQHRFDHAHESPPVMALPLVVLATVALFGGGTLNPLPHNEELWFNRLVEQPASAAIAGLGLEVHPTAEHWEHAMHAAHYPALGVSFIAILLGFLLARRMYLTKATDPAAVSARFGPMHEIISHKYYFDDLYNGVLIPGLQRLNRALAWFDRNVIDGIVNLVGLLARSIAFVAGLFDKYVIDGLVNFWRWFVRTLSAVLRLTQTGNVRDYLTLTLIGVLILAMYLAAE
ncbi:MAG: NADH-quinone oxidoreductase subunit L [Planctomycetes bacterium]|nr:NADH-quinone oxidoreductase subunit L [Planctomycetota bacterium]